jgi:hypothetical protein
MKNLCTPQHSLPFLGFLIWAFVVSASEPSPLFAEDKTSSNNTGATAEDPVPAGAKPAGKLINTAPEKPSKPISVDQIKGIGKFTLGQNFTEFPAGLLRVIDPRASGVLLRVSPYGENYLVNDVKGMTWGTIPISGMVVTFHSGILIDMQVALKAKKFDLYAADRAFKAKYGPNDPKTFPIETWKGNQVQMTLIFPDADIKDANSLDATTLGKIDLFDQAQWNKFEAARIAELKDVMEKRYQTTAKAVQDNL